MGLNFLGRRCCNVIKYTPMIFSYICVVKSISFDLQGPIEDPDVTDSVKTAVNGADSDADGVYCKSSCKPCGCLI